MLSVLFRVFPRQLGLRDDPWTSLGVKWEGWGGQYIRNGLFGFPATFLWCGLRGGMTGWSLWYTVLLATLLSPQIPLYLSLSSGIGSSCWLAGRRAASTKQTLAMLFIHPWLVGMATTHCLPASQTISAFVFKCVFLLLGIVLYS